MGASVTVTLGGGLTDGLPAFPQSDSKIAAKHKIATQIDLVRGLLGRALTHACDAIGARVLSLLLTVFIRCGAGARHVPQRSSLMAWMADARFRGDRTQLFRKSHL